jgi:hypothetical protein
LLPLTREEVAAAQKANELLRSITSHDSPYARLESKLDGFDQGLADAIRSMEEGPLVYPNPTIEDRFGNVLSAFTVFLNHMPNRLRTQFREDSPAVAAFEQACSQEYDRAFEYRLAYNLQNDYRHRGDVLHVTFGKGVGKPGRADAAISDEALDRALTDTKWQARVRKELESHARPILATDVLLVLRGCLQRVYLRTLLAERADIESAISTLQVLADRVECAGELALVKRGLPDPEWPTAEMTLTIENLDLKAARHLADLLPETERIVWPRFAIQVSPEWLESPARDALLRALADDPTVHEAVISPVEKAGAFVGVTASTEYAAQSAVARAVGRSEFQVQDQRIGPLIHLP